MKLFEISKEEFDKYAMQNENVTFYQTSSWGDLKSFTGWKSLHLAYKDKEGNVLASGLFLLKKMPVIRYYLAYCPRGFLIDFSDSSLLHSFQKDLTAYLKKQHVFELIIDPYLLHKQRDIDGNIVSEGIDNSAVVEDLKALGYKHKGFNLHYENLQPRWLFRLPIKDKTYEELEKDFRYEAKRRSRKKDLYAIDVREMTKEEIPQYKQLMNMTAQRRGFIDRPLSYYQQMYDSLHKDGILRYFVAEIDTAQCRKNIEAEIEKTLRKIEKLKEREEKNKGRIKEDEVTLNSHRQLLEQLDNCEKELGSKAMLSVVCLLTYGKEAIMLLAGNNEDYLQHFNTSNIIVTELIKLAMKEGYSYYNFYGITGDFDPKAESYGLYLYKRQYGGEVVELIGQFEYTLNVPIRKLYDFLLKIYARTKR